MPDLALGAMFVSWYEVEALGLNRHDDQEILRHFFFDPAGWRLTPAFNRAGWDILPRA